ncbi:MAG: NifU family protein [Cyclobacteriaceae bacterium]|jgi:Fe-S cluster biogenesis protein NfuA|nr:NifU family protein [Cyclobacteriaceae bacterium]
MSSTKTKKDDLNVRVEAALDKIRPYLVMDGGNVRVLEITKEKKLILEFIGNCGTCPMSTMTFKAGVEEAVKKSVPEIGHIEVVNMPAL